MMPLARFSTFSLAIAVLLGASAIVSAQAASAPAKPPAAAQLPADPWPQVLDLSNGQVLVYQPQVNKWDGNRIDLRAALAVKPTGAKDESFGVIFASARTQVDKVMRTVVFEDMKISKVDFPTLPDRGAPLTAELQKEFAARVRTMSLDRLQASLAVTGVTPPTVAVQNNPPRVLVSYSPAILVPIDGAPVMKPVPGHSRYNRVVNTRALIVQGGFGDSFYMHVYDGWLSANSLEGPWTQASLGPFLRSAFDSTAQELAKAGTVDLLDGGPKADPKPTLASGVPTIYTSQVPTELIVFKGQPDFVPIVGTQLLWSSNTTSDVADQHCQQRLLRAALRPLVQGGRTFRAVDLRRQQHAAAGLRAYPAAFARRRRAADRRRHAAGAGSRHREHRSRRQRLCRSRTGQNSRPNSTARRNGFPSSARR